MTKHEEVKVGLIVRRQVEVDGLFGREEQERRLAELNQGLDKWRRKTLWVVYREGKPCLE